MALILAMFLQQDVGRLIRDLGDDDIDVRDRATAALEALGADALPAIVEAIGTATDPERRVRLARVRDRIERGALYAFADALDVAGDGGAQQDDGVLRWWRRAGGDGGGVTVRLPLAAPAREIRLSGELRIVEQTLSGPGWWCDTHGGCHEYPIHIGAASPKGGHAWCRGFLRPFSGATKATNFEVVEGGWTAFDTGWIRLEDAVDHVLVGGNGWSFEGEIRGLRIGTR